MKVPIHDLDCGRSKDLGNDDLMLNWVRDRLVSNVQDWSDELPVLRKP